MSYFVQKPGFIDNRVMWADIIKELTSNGGFQLISVNGSTLAPTVDDVTLGIDSAVIQATPLVDLLAEEQPWRICVKVTKDETQLYCATPTQIEDDGTIAVAYNISKTTYTSNSSGGTTSNTTNTKIYSGTIGNVWNLPPSSNGAYPAGATLSFFARGTAESTTTTGSGSSIITTKTPARPGTFGYTNGDGELEVYTPALPGNVSDTFDFVLHNFDYEAYPFSYSISCTDHGVAFSSWIEGTDGYGCTQNMFVVQRAINPDGTVVVTGKAPLFCLFSVNGGGGLEANEIDTYGIMRFTVRESDINAPTLPISAVTHTPDGNAVLNPIQQVCFNENGRYDFKFPQGFNTARHSYAYQLDMIAYTSADVCSQRIDVQVQVYNEKNADNTPKLRTYRALSANSPKNTGMRPFVLVPTV